MNYLKKLFLHLHTINHHRHLVIKHCSKCGILLQGLFHDLSKYSFVEFFNSVKYYTNGSKSPNEQERLINGYSKAWLHHKGRNKHHFEYWYDFNPEILAYSPVKMPIKYVKEMFCDRVAACKTYKKELYTDASSFEYYDSRKTKYLLHKETALLLEKWLIMLKDFGEKKTFQEIKNTNCY